MLKTQKIGQVNGHEQPIGDGVTTELMQANVEADELRSQLSQRDSTINQLTVEVSISVIILYYITLLVRRYSHIV